MGGKDDDPKPRPTARFYKAVLDIVAPPGSVLREEVRTTRLPAVDTERTETVERTETADQAKTRHMPAVKAGQYAKTIRADAVERSNTPPPEDQEAYELLIASMRRDDESD